MYSCSPHYPNHKKVDEYRPNKCGQNLMLPTGKNYTKVQRFEADQCVPTHHHSDRQHLAG
jgi:hypothetical protein